MRFWAIGVVLAVCSGPATAQTRPPIDMQRFQRQLDGLVAQVAGLVFAQADANRDGTLTRDEVSRLIREQGGMGVGPDPRSWAALDLNQDGGITQSEMVAGMNAVRARTQQGRAPF